jgi:hypothetical protein
MSIGFVFWLLMILWLVFGIWSYRAAPASWPFAAGNGFMFVLLFLIGWKVFGWPIAG